MCFLQKSVETNRTEQNELPVMLTIFEEVKVKFRLHFAEQYYSKRTHYVTDFSNVLRSIQWLED